MGVAGAALAADPLPAGGRRHPLADEAGLDPSPALGELERRIAGGAAGPARRVPPRAGAAWPATRLFGREGQIGALRRLLATERLVTVVGSGGVGKTSVAREVAPLGDAAVLLLAPVTDPAAVPHALAAALDLQVVQGDVLAACVALLGGEPRLLMVDNCEHLLDAVRDTVAVLLAGCPGLTVLATSREPLGLAAERVWRLTPLPVPQPADEAPGADAIERVASVAIFLDRAGRVRTGFAPGADELRLVAGIVRRLDGVPLAIELAAGRLSTFSLADLHERLDRSLDLLGGARPDADARHRTLRATVEWSYQLLAEDERALFRALSVFVDGVDLTAAEAVAADLGVRRDPGAVLARLVDASMIEVTFDGRTRYRMLETLRAFGLDRLAAAGEDHAAERRLLRWAVETMTAADAAMTTEREPEADAVLRREPANLRAAWRLAREAGAMDDAVAMVTALWDVVAYRDLVEMRGWAEELAGDPALAGHPRAAAVLGMAAEVAYNRGDHERTERLARAGLDRATDAEGQWFCLTALSVAELSHGAYADSVEHNLAAAALGRRPRENLGIAALAAAYSGDHGRARELAHQMLDDAVSPTMRAFASYAIGEAETAAGSRDRAERHYVEAIALARHSGATFLVGVATVGLLAALADSGRVHDALRGYRDVIDYFARTGNWTHLWTSLRNLAQLLRRLGDDEPAALIDAAADQAPDAPVLGPSPDAPAAPSRDHAAARAAGRAGVLDAARRAIEHNLRTVRRPVLSVLSSGRPHPGAERDEGRSP